MLAAEELENHPLLAELAEILPLAADREWRLNNLYLVVDRNGKMQPWKAYPWQQEYRRNRHNLNFIPKARQLGMSYEIVIENGDECIFTDNMTAGIIDFRQDDAWEKLDKFRVAWMNGPLYDWPDPRIKLLWQVIHLMNPLVTDNNGELAWSNGSSFQASTSFTGRTPQRLHWSEAGPMSAQRPSQAKRIRRGALNSVASGCIVDIETTMEGPRVGVAFEICELAMGCRTQKVLRQTQWKLHFFNWVGVPEYRNPGCKPTKKETIAYFQRAAKLGIKVHPEEQSWWEDKKATIKGEMTQQFPLTIEEALSFDGDKPRFQKSALDYLGTLLQGGAQKLKYGVLDQQLSERPTFSEYEEDSAWFRLWEGPQVGCKYVLAADFCTAEFDEITGEMADKHAVLVVRAPYMVEINGRKGIVRAAVVGAIQVDDRTPLDVLARRIYLMADYYGHCMVVPEINTHIGYVSTLRTAGCRSIWRRHKHIDDPAKGVGRTAYEFGWKTTPSTKPLIIEKLDKALREEEIMVWCPRIVSELRTYQQTNEALAGQHDDWVMALAIAYHALGSATMFHEERKLLPLLGHGGTPPAFGQQWQSGDQE